VTATPDFTIYKGEYLKETKLKDVNRKPLAGCQMVSVLITLNDSGPGFQVRCIFKMKYVKNGARYSHSYCWT